MKDKDTVFRKGLDPLVSCLEGGGEKGKSKGEKIEVSGQNQRRTRTSAGSGSGQNNLEVISLNCAAEATGVRTQPIL